MASVPKESRLKNLRDRTDVPTRFDQQQQQQQRRESGEDPSTKDDDGRRHHHHHHQHRHKHRHRHDDIDDDGGGDGEGPEKTRLRPRHRPSAEVKRKWKSAQQRISYQDSVNFFVSRREHDDGDERRDRGRDQGTTYSAHRGETADEGAAIIAVDVDDPDDTWLVGPVQPPTLLDSIGAHHSSSRSAAADVLCKPSSKQPPSSAKNRTPRSGDAEDNDDEEEDGEEVDAERGDEEEGGIGDAGVFRRGSRHRRQRRKSAAEQGAGITARDDVYSSSRANWNRLQNRRRSMRLNKPAAETADGGEAAEEPDEGWPAVLASSRLSRSFHRHTLSPRDVELVDDGADAAADDVVRLVPPIALSGMLNDRTAAIAGPHRLVIKLGTLKFRHHPLFSVEHVLAQDFADLVTKAMHHSKDSGAQHRERVRELRSALTSDPDDEVARQELELAVRAREDDFVRRRTDLRAALNAWVALKRRREDQGFNLTPHRLIVLLSENQEASKAEWDAEVDSEARAVEREYLELTKRSREDYEQRATSSRSSEGGEASSEPAALPPIVELPTPHQIRKMAEDRVCNYMKPWDEPDIVLKMRQDLEVIPKSELKSRQEIARIRAAARLRYSVRVYVNQKLVNETKSLSLAVGPAQLFEVVFDESVICHLYRSPDSIVISLIESQLGTAKKKKKREMARIHLALPAREDLEDITAEEEHGFTDEAITSPSHEGVGSGVQFAVHKGEEEGKDEDEKDDEHLGLSHRTLHTNGCFSCSVGWATDQDGQSTAPMECKAANKEFLRNALATTDPISAMGLEPALDLGQLSRWSRDEHRAALDPQSKLGMLVRLDSKEEETSPDRRVPVGRCHLKDLDSELSFCSEEELANNPRFKVLRLRHFGVGQFKNLTFVPPSFSNHHQPGVNAAIALLKEHEARKRSQGAPATLSDGLGRAAAHAKGLMLARESLRDWICKAMESSQDRKSWEDVVYEESVPDIGVVGGKLLQPFQPRRPLKPAAVDRRPLNIEAHHMLAPTDIMLVVNVSQAADLPMRAFSDSVSNAYVEVCFQELRTKTAATRGSSPGWNEVLSLPIRAPKATDEIILTVFDEVSVDILEDSRERDSTVHRRLEKFWLGSLKIRISALLSQPRLEGVFRLITPPVLLGYVWPTNSPTPFSQEPWTSPARTSSPADQLTVSGSIGSIRAPGSGVSEGSGNQGTYLTLFLTTEPPITASESHIDVACPTEEPRHAFEEGIKWASSYLERFHKRRLTPFVCDSSGRAVLVSRFLRPLPPPVDIIHQHQGSSFLGKAKACAYFVSLIPHIPDLANDCLTRNLWLTCDQFLASLAGDTHQHTVLLANYFLYLSNVMFQEEDSAEDKVDVKVACGRGVPEGVALYVLTCHGGTWKKKADIQVWVPMEGNYYSTTDPFCPLSKLFYVFDASDVWANIQEDSSVGKVNFDVTNTSCWSSFSAAVKSAATNKHAKGLNLFSLQPSKIVYSPPDATLARELEKSLEASLKDKFMGWRKTSRTQWNRHCTAVLRNSVVLLEASQSGAGLPSGRLAEDYSEKMRDLVGAYDLFGFPLHFSYRGLEDITKALFSTRVHERMGSELEFALATHAHPYPCGIFSVWVYVACLRSKK